MSIDNEYAFLGHCLNSSKTLSSFYIHEKLFQNAKTRKIYRSIMDIVDIDGSIPDLVSLRDKGIDLDDISKMSELGYTHSAKYYYSKIIDQYKTIGLQTASRMLETGLKENNSPDYIIKSVSEHILNIAKISDCDSINHIKDLLVTYANTIEDRFHNKTLPGITTGFEKLDRFTLGLQNKQYIVVGARPSDGKTAIMLNMALSAAKDNKTVCIINLESNNSEMITRFVSQITMINGQKISAGMISNKELMKVADACAELAKRNIYLYDTPNITIDQVIARARQAVKIYKCDIVFVDYVQIIRNTGQFQSKREKVEDVSIRLKELARELNVPIVVMAQLNRNAANSVPTVSEFKESGQIEQDADVALLLYHKREKEDGKPTAEIESSWIIIDKNRNGAKASIKVRFAAEYVKFMEVENK